MVVCPNRKCDFMWPDVRFDVLANKNEKTRGICVPRVFYLRSFLLSGIKRNNARRA